MKTKYILAVLFIVGFMSCDSYFRVVNTVHPDGRFEKEIHTFGDSLFLQGDLQHNPFPFTLDDTWVITCTDSTSYYSYFVRKSTTNVKVNRMYTSAEESSGSMQIENPYTPIFSPSEKVNIYNRWFYTYYSYQSTFTSLKEVTIIPLDNYLDDEEVKLWLQGDPIQTEGMNGVEIYGKLFDIREKFYQWINRNMLEINYRILCQQTHRSSQQERITELQKVDRDILFKDMNGDQPSYSEDVIDPSFDKLCKFLDNQFSTGFYSALYTTHKETMDKQLEEQTLILNLFGVEQLYEVRLPGKLLTTNAPHIKDESPVWKVNAYYFLAEDFVLTAESRKSNAWAFIVTGLLIGIAIVSSILIKNRKN